MKLIIVIFGLTDLILQQFRVLIMCLTSCTGSLVDKRGKILVPGIYDSVAPLTAEEQKLYEKIDFDLDEYCKDVGVDQLLHDTKAKKLFMLFASLIGGNVLFNFGSFTLFEPIVLYFFHHRNKSSCTVGDILLFPFMVLRGLSLKQEPRRLFLARSSASFPSALCLTWTLEMWRSR